MADASQDTGSPPKRRIIVLEDDQNAARSLGELLTTAGHDVTLAVDGADAASRLDEDVALLTKPYTRTELA